MVMCIVGGALAVLFGVLYIFCSSLFLNIGTLGIGNSDVFSESQNASVSFAVTIFLVIGICMVVGGILGFIGGLIVRRKNIAAGVLMIIAAVLGINLFSVVLFILGAVFALRQDRSQMVAPPYYMYPPYAPYPPQAYPQQSPYPPQGYAPYPPQAYTQQPGQQPAPPSENPTENPQP